MKREARRTNSGMGVKMKTVLAIAIMALAAAAWADAPQVSNVTLSQGADRTVTVAYDLANAPAVVTLSIETNVSGDVWAPVDDKALWRMTGDVNRKVTAASGTIKWVPELDFDPGNVRAKVTAWPMDDTPGYLVVSIASGAACAEDRIRYYTSPNALPGGLLDNFEYRTSRLVLRKILAKGVTWKMGSDNSVETAATGFTNERQHNVTLAHDYYIGVFPLTHAQYMWVNGGWTGTWFTRETDLRIADALWYSNFQCARGAANYPAAPSSDSTLGRLRTLTGNLIDFDLPGEAEWEYAARAGYGDNYFGNGSQMQMTYANRLVDSELDKLGRYRGNQGSVWYSVWTDARDHGAEMGVTNGPPVAGSYAPNVWGLYDTLGGVQEWCLDWYQADITSLNGAINVCLTDGSKMLDGETAGTSRVVRGGSWCGAALYSRPAWRGGQQPGYRGDTCETGMRVKCYMGLK